jgi:hypothetical protein
MLQYSGKIVRLFFISVWAAAGFASNSRNLFDPSLANGEEMVVIRPGENDFTSLSPYRLSEQEKAKVLQKGIQPERMEEILLAKPWRLNLDTISSSVFPVAFSGEEDALVISSKDFIEFYALEVFPHSGMESYYLTWEVAGSGEMKAGFYGYGTVSLRELESFTCASSAFTPMGKTIIIDALGIERFRIAFAVNGKLKIKNIRLCKVKAADDLSLVEGTVEEVSVLPPPEKSDYPDCCYTAKFAITSIRAGQATPQVIQLVIPGFFNYKLTDLAKLKKGEKWRLRLIPFEQLPAARKEIQQANDLELFDLENFYVTGGLPLRNFSESDSGILFSQSAEYQSVFENPVNPPIGTEAKAVQAAFIQRELAQINAMLDRVRGQEDNLNREFERSWRETQKQYALIDGRYIWGNIDGAYFACPPRLPLLDTRAKILAGNLESLKALNDFFEANGVQFIIQIIPDYYDIAARVMNKEFRDIVDYKSAIAVKQLLEVGIEAVYSSRALIERYNKKELMFFYPNNAHPAEGAQDILTDQILERLDRFRGQLKSRINPEAFSVVSEKTAYGDKYCWPGNVNIGRHQAGAAVRCDHVLYHGRPIEFDSQSRVLIIGNSFIQTPMPRSGYAAYLARKLNYIPNTYQVNGSGPLSAIPQSLFNAKGKYLKDKLIVVLPMGISFLTDGQPMLNLRQLDMSKQHLSGKSLVQEIAISNWYSSPEISTKIQPQLSPKFMENWIAFLEGSTHITIGIPKKDQKIELAQFHIPQEIDRTKDAVVVLQAAAFPQQNISIHLNGESQQVPPCNYAPVWQLLTFAVPADTEEIKIQIHGWQANSLAAIKKVMIYQ